MALLLLFGAPGLASPGVASPSAAALAASGSERGASPSEQAPLADVPVASELQLPEAPPEYSSYEAGWLSLSYHPSLSAQMQPLKQNADAVRRELRELLGRPVLEKVHVRVARNVHEMALLVPAGSKAPEYASGLAYSELGLVLLTAEPRYPGEQHQLLEVFRHELAHIALHDAVGRENVPRWFNEGFAVHASGEAYTARLQTLWTATLAKTLLPFRDLTNRFPSDSTQVSIAYAQAADLVRFLLKTGEEHRFRALIARMVEGQAFESSLSDAYSTDLATLESEWRADVARRYTFWPILFGGSTIWAGALLLFFWGYWKRKRRAQVKLDRWAREEAVEDARRALLQASLNSPQAIQVVFTHRGNAESPRETTSPLPPSGIPQIEHEGGWHTLH